MPTGKVKFFNDQKGFGFIVKDDGSGDVFVHKSALQFSSDLIAEGDALEFDIEQGRNGKSQAVNVKLLSHSGAA